MLLFSYGANMAASEMAAGAPAARFLGVARLDGFALGFRRRSVRWRGGAADIVPAPGSSVWGVLHELPDDQFGDLDAKEGLGFAYRRRSVCVEHDGRRVSAVAYEVIDKEPSDVPPTADYLELLRDAGRERGLPDDHLAVLDAFPSHIGEDPSQIR